MSAVLRLSSGAPVSRAVLGTSHLGMPFVSFGAAERRGFAVLDAAVGAGCNALDLAESYMAGGTERLVGKWLRARANREQLFLITKGGHPTPLIAPMRLRPKDLIRDLEGSLRRLGVDSFDLYLLHRDHPAADLAELVETLGGFQRQGKVRAWGVSNWTHPRIAALRQLAAEVALSSPHLSLVDWTTPPWPGSVSIAGDAGIEARAFHQATQLPVLAYSPLGNGFLAGRGDSPSAIYGTADNLARRARALELAGQRGRSLAQVALAYVLSQPFPTYVSVAVGSGPHMQSALAAAALILNPEERRWLERGGPG